MFLFSLLRSRLLGLVTAFLALLTPSRVALRRKRWLRTREMSLQERLQVGKLPGKESIGIVIGGSF
jgi:hypothetical protein